MDELELRKEDLEVSILQAELAHPKYTKDEIVHWISQFKYGDVDSIDYQRQIIDIFVNSFRLFDDRIIFTFNYKDGTETIPIADIEAALGSDFSERVPPGKELYSTKLQSSLKCQQKTDEPSPVFCIK